MSGVKEKVSAVYFVSMGALIYYLVSQVITIPFTIPVRLLVMIVFLFSTFVVFVVRPNIGRAAVALKGALLLAVPLLVMITVTLPIWFGERVEWYQIYRSLWHYLIYTNQLITAMMAAAYLYLFGQRGIWYHLISILIANLMMIGTIMLEYGIGTYLKELAQLIITFAGDTGGVIVKAEIHELAFCLGAYLVYMLLFFRKNREFLLLLALSAFCFLSAFKRIAVAAILVAVAVGWFLRFLHARGWDRTARRLMDGSLLAVCAVLLLYIAFVRMGGFHWLEELGINTMSRVHMYDQVEDLYTFSPAYMGHGMGFMSYELTGVIHLWEGSIHNDFLQFYVDLGFWGYIAWMLSLTLLRVKYFGRKNNMESAISTYTLILYLLVLSSTDNTLNYPMFYVTTGVLMLGHSFDQNVMEEDKRWFDFVEEQNRVASGAEPRERKARK